jgi:hypothetical protein
VPDGRSRLKNKETILVHIRHLGSVKDSRWSYPVSMDCVGLR